jgi:hypothetical protein
MSGSAAARIHMENHNIRLRSGSAGHRPLSGDEDEESDHEEPIQVNLFFDSLCLSSYSTLHFFRLFFLGPPPCQLG